MATPILAVLSAGASLMPSPVMATMWPLALKRADNPQLVLGIDAGEHAHLFDDCIELGVRHGAQLGAGHEPRARLEDFELAGDRLGGCRMIAGDHHRADVRPLGDGDGGLRLRARRIDHADQAEQHKIVLDALGQLDLDDAASAAAGSMPRAAAGMVRVAIASVRSAWPASASLRRDSSARRSSLERDNLAVVPEMAGISRAGFRARP